MTFGGHIRLAGAVICIIGAVISDTILCVIGLSLVAVGVTFQIDGLERRVKELEGDDDAETETNQD